MDTTDLEIVFDENGFCNHCTEFLAIREKHNYQGKESDEKLAEIIEEIKRAGKGRPYDCITGLSGGADSSYLAYFLRQKGLRVLAVHMDNGWSSEVAVTNIKNITKKLEIDYETYVLDWEEFKAIQLAFLKASVPEAETPTDIAIVAALHHFAAKYNVKYILSGGNLATEGILPKSWHYNAKDLKYFNHIQKTFAGRRLKKIPTFDYRKEIYFKLVRGVKVFYPLNYTPFAKAAAVKLLEEQLEWKNYGGKHHESKYTKFIQSYYLFQKFGIDYRKATLSSQICAGESTRPEALEQLKSKPFDESKIEDEKHYISKKLGITADELEQIINMPAKWYWDYPNDDRKLSLIYNTYRKIFKKEKLASF
jgi:N-acetyl sugar amidotransferase